MLATSFVFLSKLHQVTVLSPSCPVLLPRTVWRYTRFLCQVKNLRAQRHEPPKRRRLAQNLWLTGEEEEPVQTDSAGYMDRLWTYLIALSIAGIEKTASPPRVSVTFATSSADYVLFWCHWMSWPGIGSEQRSCARACPSTIELRSSSIWIELRELSGHKDLPTSKIHSRM